MVVAAAVLAEKISRQVWANLFEPAFGNLLENPTEKSLLVHGGAGGIGSTALALASQLGVRTVTTVSGAAKWAAATLTLTLARTLTR